MLRAPSAPRLLTSTPTDQSRDARTTDRLASARPWLPAATSATVRENTAPGRVTMLIAPPTAPSPYSTAAELPRRISTRSMLSSGRLTNSTAAMSMSLRRRPLTSTSEFCAPRAPNPRISTVARAPAVPPNRSRNWIPAAWPRNSGNVCAGEREMSSAVYTVTACGVSAWPRCGRDTVISSAGGVSSALAARAGAAEIAAATASAARVEVIGMVSIRFAVSRSCERIQADAAQRAPRSHFGSQVGFPAGH